MQKKNWQVDIINFLKNENFQKMPLTLNSYLAKKWGGGNVPLWRCACKITIPVPEHTVVQIEMISHHQQTDISYVANYFENFNSSGTSVFCKARNVITVLMIIIMLDRYFCPFQEECVLDGFPLTAIEDFTHYRNASKTWRSLSQADNRILR